MPVTTDGAAVDAAKEANAPQAPQAPEGATEAPKADAGSETKSKRVAYCEAEGIATPKNENGKLAGVPTDYNSSKHLPPKKKDFAQEGDYWRFKAEQHKLGYEKALKEAETCDVSGNAEQRKLLKQREKFLSKLKEMEQSLLAQGIDLEALKKSAE